MDLLMYSVFLPMVYVYGTVVVGVEASQIDR